MAHMPRLVAVVFLLLLSSYSSSAHQTRSGAAGKPQPPPSLRLYVFDCGTLDIADTGRFRLKREEVSTDKLSVGCYLVAHPRGTLVWDTGAVPDSMVAGPGTPIKYRIVLPDSQERNVTVTYPLKTHLAQAGYAPANITYVAISHAHKDHTANLNQFAASTWLVRPVEREFMFRPGNERVEPRFYNQLERSRTIAIEKDEYDVFGDGTVVIKAAPGHTPGHEVLVLNLAKSGRIMVAGDLYHYPPERTFQRKPPDNEFNVEQSAASRAMIEEYLKKTKTSIWIQHDFRANSTLKKSPAFYE